MAPKLISLLIDDAAKEGYGEYRTRLDTRNVFWFNSSLDGSNHGII
jgi:hypothetical protein